MDTGQWIHGEKTQICFFIQLQFACYLSSECYYDSSPSLHSPVPACSSLLTTIWFHLSMYNGHSCGSLWDKLWNHPNHRVFFIQMGFVWALQTCKSPTLIIKTWGWLVTGMISLLWQKDKPKPAGSSHWVQPRLQNHRDKNLHRQMKVWGINTSKYNIRVGERHEICTGHPCQRRKTGGEKIKRANQTHYSPRACWYKRQTERLISMKVR